GLSLRRQSESAAASRVELVRYVPIELERIIAGESLGDPALGSDDALRDVMCDVPDGPTLTWADRRPLDRRKRVQRPHELREPLVEKFPQLPRSAARSETSCDRTSALRRESSEHR